MNRAVQIARRACAELLDRQLLLIHRCLHRRNGVDAAAATVPLYWRFAQLSRTTASMPATLTASPLRALQAFSAVLPVRAPSRQRLTSWPSPHRRSRISCGNRRSVSALGFYEKRPRPCADRRWRKTCGRRRSGARHDRGCAERFRAAGGGAAHQHAIELRRCTGSVPRLSRFQVRHPDIELLLSTSTRIVDLTTESLDCAIRLGRGNWPGGGDGGAAIGRNWSRPVVPQWLAARRICSPRDLTRAQLLQSKSRRGDWATWFKAARRCGLQDGRWAALRDPRARDPGGDRADGRRGDRPALYRGGAGSRPADDSPQSA